MKHSAKHLTSTCEALKSEGEGRFKGEGRWFFESFFSQFICEELFSLKQNKKKMDGNVFGV